MLLHNIFYLRKVGLNYVSHLSKVLEQWWYLLLQCRAKDIGDFGFHRSDDGLYFFLIAGVLNNKSVLKFHDSLYYELKVVCHLLFIFWREDIVVFQDFCYDFMKIQEWLWQFFFNFFHFHYVVFLLVQKCDYRHLVKTEVLFQLGPRDLFLCSWHLSL